MTTPRKNAGKTRGKPFAPGNPGRPKGARNRATLTLEKLMDGSVEDVAKSVIMAAKSGDTSAARLVLERIMPARKDSPVMLALPDMKDAAGLLEAGNRVLEAMAGGELTPAEADAVFALIERQRRIVETVEIERRLSALEDKHDAE
ncbi:hypothetical protein J2X73_004806 [Novosphingobium sp. 1748]|uniref:hypothetical protein n=1 Tax=Novosphingobium sp. 1748 TaxID=2817760 RepID=UPI0028596665|nr:hypothetical protein [Novosphingobium sp. 1748]MDR6710399.1 hypothetical protein [Novosphingobium sp. 1748]